MASGRELLQVLGLQIASVLVTSGSKQTTDCTVCKLGFVEFVWGVEVLLQADIDFGKPLNGSQRRLRWLR
jgi:hypothetical protein